MNISGGRTDYSFLFNNNKTNDSLYNMTMSVDFSELNMIKSGIYKTALDAYYLKETPSIGDDNTVDAKDKTETNNSSKILDDLLADTTDKNTTYTEDGDKTTVLETPSKFDVTL